MKKVLLFLLLIIISFKVNALTNNCTISGDDSIYLNDKSMSEIFYTTSLGINLDNIEDISSLKINIGFDSKNYDFKECSLFGETVTCNISNNIITYNYNYSSNNDVNNAFFNIKFISNDNTPSEGSTNIEVKFLNVKDKNNKSIEIDPCTKELSYKEYDTYYVPSEIHNDEENNEVDLDNTSTYIKSLRIKGYNIEFDKDTLEYNLKVDSETNKLDIDVELESSSSKYIINGASDLNSFGGKVIILVTNTNDETREYTINITRETEKLEETNITKSIEAYVNKLNIKKYLPYILGSALLLLLIVFIVRKRNAKKMDKFLDNL